MLQQGFLALLECKFRGLKDEDDQVYVLAS